MQKDNNPSLHLRVTVTSGGCHGFQYLMSLGSAKDLNAEEDTVFEAAPAADEMSAQASGAPPPPVEGQPTPEDTLIASGGQAAQETQKPAPSSQGDEEELSQEDALVASGGTAAEENVEKDSAPSSIGGTGAPAQQSSAGSGRARVVLDEPSLELLKGSTVDFTMELIGSQFKIVGNPRAKSSCGCGTSFDVA